MACVMVSVGSVARLMVNEALAADGPATGTRASATRPIAMKPISAAEEASYAAALEGRAQAVLDDLKLADAAKAEQVKIIRLLS